jgi:hypothetical protein
MNDIDRELGLFIPWACIYPLVQYSDTPTSRRFRDDIHPKTAEYWAIKFYSAHLRKTYQRPFWLNEYINRRTGYEPYDIILEVMRKNFGNVFGRGKLKKYTQGQLPASKLSMGRARKPDVLAIGIKGSAIHIEFMEVTTQGRAEAGLEQLSEKIDLMRQLKPEIEQKLREANEAARSSLYPAELEIHAATWKPSRNQLRTLIMRHGESLEQQLAKIQWLCLKPTYRVNEGNGHDGLILYEIHEVNYRQPIPREIIQALRRHIQMAKAQHQQFLPIDAEAFWRQNQLAASDMAIIAGAASAYALVVIFFVIMPEIGVPFFVGAGAIGADGLLGAGLAEGAGGAEVANVGAGLAEGAGGAEAANVANEADVLFRVATPAQRMRVVEAASEIADTASQTAEVSETLVKALKVAKPKFSAK